jgi:hypothetical protein
MFIDNDVIAKIRPMLFTYHPTQLTPVHACIHLFLSTYTKIKNNCFSSFKQEQAFALWLSEACKLALLKLHF